MEPLARWFGARTLVVEDGRALVVERSCHCRTAVRRAVAERPVAAYFDTRDDRPVDRRRHGHLPGRRGAGGRRRVVVRQYLLPDFPFEPSLLRALVADLATSERLVTYNGRTFDLPMLAARLTFHGLFREQATIARCPRRPAARRRGACSGGRSAERGWRTWSPACWACGGIRLPGQRGAGALFRLPGRRLAGHPGRGARPQLPGRRQPRPAGRGAVRGCAPAAGATRRCSTRAAWRSTCFAPAPLTMRWSSSSRPRRSPADPAEANALRRVASRLLLATGEVERAEELWRIGTRRASVDAATAWIEVARIRERHRGTWRGVGGRHRGLPRARHGAGARARRQHGCHRPDAAACRGPSPATAALGGRRRSTRRA